MERKKWVTELYYNHENNHLFYSNKWKSYWEASRLILQGNTIARLQYAQFTTLEHDWTKLCLLLTRISGW